MDILEKIIQHKKFEVALHQKSRPVKMLEQSLFFERECLSLKTFLKDKNRSGLITEFKRRSPSKGMINAKVLPEDVTTAYAAAGASAISVLTDIDFFGGSNADLITARNFNRIPVLRKDFIIDEYQIIEAKSIGADAILLIAACLEREEIDRLANFAKSLGLSILLEIHNQEELRKIHLAADAVGVNNRNLKTFEVSLRTSVDLVDQIPDEFAKVSESGIYKPEIVIELKKIGYDGFLIGENFMKMPDPGAACQQFTDDIRRLESEAAAN